MPTLMASAMMKARLAKVAPPPAPPPAAQYAADEPAKQPPPKPAPPTPAIVQSPPPITAEAAARRRARYERQEALFRQLRGIAPALFATMPPPPMAIGIHRTIVERLGLDQKDARSVGRLLRRHVQRPSYQRGLIAEGAVRLDLDGNPAGEVTPEERAQAAATYEQLRAKTKTMRDAGN
jgi:ProP effector